MAAGLLAPTMASSGVSGVLGGGARRNRNKTRRNRKQSRRNRNKTRNNRNRRERR